MTNNDPDQIQNAIDSRAPDVAIRTTSHPDDQAVGLTSMSNDAFSKAPSPNTSVISSRRLPKGTREARQTHPKGKIHKAKAPAHRSRIVEKHSLALL
jgi:hypothetical protein